jgi:RNA polymerase sigma-70 factor (ECF subfamily)
VDAANSLPLPRVLPLESGRLRGRGPAAGSPGLRVVPGGGGVDDDAARSDDQLFGDYLGGREAAFAELVRRHERAVRAVARRYVARPEDVLDLAQRAFLRAIEAGRRGRWLRLGRVPPFGPLLLRTVVNLAKNQARDAARWRRAPLEALDGAQASLPAGTASLEREERVRALRAAVTRLPRRQREVLTLRIDGELPFAEVARTLGITENAAKVHFHHATRRLAELVAAAQEP